MTQIKPLHLAIAAVGTCLVAIIVTAIIVGGALRPPVTTSPITTISSASNGTASGDIPGSVRSKPKTDYSFVPSPDGPNRMIVVLLDNSGSFHYFYESIEKIRDIARGLRTGDVLYVFYVMPFTTMSNLIVQPDSRLIQAVQSVGEGTIYCPEADEYRKDYIDQVNRIKFDGLTKTDAYGALFQANQVLAGDTDQLYPDKYLLAFTDLGDTEKRENLAAQTSFSGVKVKCFYFPDQITKEADKTIAPDQGFWAKRFGDWGAKRVRILDAFQSNREAGISEDDAKNQKPDTSEADAEE